jgi:glycosyltransferase involved in cell wall biosynthesis
VAQAGDSGGYADIGTVTVISVSPVLGGGELTVLRMALALSTEVPVVVAGGAKDPLLARARAAGLATRSLAIGTKLGRRTAAASLLRYPWAKPRLQRAVRDATAEGWCVLQYKWEETLWGGEVAPERVALWEHGPIPAELARLPWLGRRLRRAFNSAGAVFAWSDPAAAAVVELCGREALPLRHGVDVDAAERAAGERDRLRGRLGVPGDALVVAFVGRVTEDKGVVEAARALAELPRAHLFVGGEGPATARAVAAAADAGARDRLHMLGHVEQPLDLLAAADVSILLTRSRGEGRPLAALESLAVGTPVVAATGSPAMQALAHHDGIVLAADESPAAIAAAVSEATGRPRPAAELPQWGVAARTFLGALRQSATARSSSPAIASTE